jgi:LuxR family quorum-sensing system transcriptional regulator CciR
LSQLSDVNAFILASRRARTAGDLRDLLCSITHEMGFHSFALVQHVKDFSRENDKFLAVTNLSENWVDYFLEQKLHADEPIYAASRRTGVGFRFGDLPSLIKITDRHRNVQRAMRGEGITDGFCVPAHIPGEANGSCTFVVRDNSPLPARNLPMAQLAGNFAYEAARHLLRSGVRLVGRPLSRSAEGFVRRTCVPRLTTRQLECIIFVAQGKTDWEIAKILGLHEQTVTQHLNEARRRCGVSRRSELVIHALYHGYVTFEDVLKGTPLL